MNKKYRKFKRDPKLFFKDMYNKRAMKIGMLGLKKYDGFQSYTIVSAAYNVEKYLNFYFESLIKQRLDFKKHIQVIIVDDGSTDTTAEIVQKWQAKYPQNITYIFKQNGGQASARNLGLQYVKTDWVTFIDPDDFVDPYYFYNVNLSCSKHKNIQLIGCNLVFYIEDKNQYADSHPLKYKFIKNETLLPVSDTKKHVQLSASTAFFRTEILRDNAINFNSQVKPSFEDAHFVNYYYAHLTHGRACFIKKAKYYYRKRSDGSSTLDTVWQKETLFYDVLKYGCLDSLKYHAEKTGKIPKHIQRTVVYHLIWYVKRLIVKVHELDWLEQAKKVRFLALIDEIFTYIDKQVVMEFELSGSWFFHKVGMLNCFKQTAPSFQICYVQAVDKNKKMIHLRYFSGNKNALEVFKLDDVDTIPLYKKIQQHNFLDRIFTYETHIWLPYDNSQQKLAVTIEQLNAGISLKGKHYESEIKVNQILERLEYNKNININNKYNDAWIFMDSEFRADDNAEHLYRFILNKAPDLPIYFVINRQSRDWLRLSNDGFRLLAYGSAEHERALRSCDKIISSHIDQCVVNYFKDGSLLDKKIVFLQHGVIKDDLSDWLNTKKIDCFITTSKAEYESIAGNFNRYKFSEKETLLAGLPRHDRLVFNESHEKIIFIMPTWRNYLVKSSAKSELKESHSHFIESEYSKHWSQLLKSNELNELVKKQGYSVVFAAHPNLNNYIKLWHLPDYIRVIDLKDQRIQPIFKSAALLITDYSSVAFEMAKLSKSIIYFQFDADSIYSGGHTYSKGYFDYIDNGLGPVVTTAEGVLVELEASLQNNCIPQQKYLERMQSFFAFHDDKNCERVYQGIKALDESRDLNVVNIELLNRSAESAWQSGCFNLAISRYEKLNHLQPSVASVIKLIKGLLIQGRFDDAEKLLNASPINSSELDLLKANLFLKLERWPQLELLLPKIKRNTSEWVLLELSYYLETAQNEKIKTLSQAVLNSQHSDLSQIKAMLEVISHIELTHPQYKLEMIKTKELGFSYKLFLVKWLTDDKRYQAASVLLSHLTDKCAQIPHELTTTQAKLAHHQGNWQAVIDAINIAFYEENECLPLRFGILKLSSLINLNELELAQKLSHALLEKYNSDELLHLCAYLAKQLKLWNECKILINQMALKKSKSLYLLALAHRMQGEIEDAAFILFEQNLSSPKSAEECLLRAEVADLTENWNESVYSWQQLLSLFSSYATHDAWQRLHNARVMQREQRHVIKSQNHLNL